MFLLIFVRSFVCEHYFAKISQPIFTKFDEKVAHGPWKKLFDFGGNPDLDSDLGIFNGIL